MIEVRSSYLVSMTNVREAIEIWKGIRDTAWPILEWRGRIQQLLHGHAQQSCFVWSSEWKDLQAWESALTHAKEEPVFVEAMNEIRRVSTYGWELEIFSILEPWIPADSAPGKVEVRSSYYVQMQNVEKAEEVLRKGQEIVWPVLKWSGQNQQLICGKSSKSLFVWSSVWDSLADWEMAMTIPVGRDTFRSWFKEWTDTVAYGGPREVLRNL